jgi:hypothetical protein
MNNRIKELAKQAGATTMQRSGWIDYGTLDLDVEKFAELIVRECAGLCSITASGRDAEAIEEAILKHFGVEE